MNRAYIMMTGESSSAWNNQPIEFTVEKWQEIWGEIDHIRWCEIKPDIPNKEADDSDCVYYGDSIVLGNWTGAYKLPPTNHGWGWGWQENEKELHKGTLRYRVHVENWFLGNKVQEVTTPRGVELFRVSVQGNYPSSEIVKWASSYINVPYVMNVVGYGNPPWPEPYGRNEYYDDGDDSDKTKMIKSKNKGYDAIDCSGLAGWSYIWAGEDLNPAGNKTDSVDIENTGADKLEEYYGKVDKTQEDVQDADMWFIDGNEDGWITHVGIYIEIHNEDWVIHGSADQDSVILQKMNESEVNWIDWWAGDVINQAGIGRRPHNPQDK